MTFTVDAPTLPSEIALSLERATDLLERAYDHLMARHASADHALKKQRATVAREFRRQLEASSASNDLRALELIDLELQERFVRLRSLMLSAALQPFDQLKPRTSRWFDCLGYRKFGVGSTMDFISAMKAKEPSALMLARAYRLPPSANLFRTFALSAVVAPRPALSTAQYRSAFLEHTADELRAMIATGSSAYSQLEAVTVFDTVRPTLEIGTVYTMFEGDTRDTEFRLLDPDGVISKRDGGFGQVSAAYAFHSRSERTAFLLAPFVLTLTPEEIAGIAERRATYPTESFNDELQAAKRRPENSASPDDKMALTRTEAFALLATNLETRALLRDGDEGARTIELVCAGAEMVSQSLQRVLGAPVAALHAVRAEVIGDLLELHFKLSSDLPATWETQPDWDDEDSDGPLTSLDDQAHAQQAILHRAQQAFQDGVDPDDLELLDDSDLPWAWTVSEPLEGGGHRLSLSCQFC